MHINHYARLLWKKVIFFNPFFQIGLLWTSFIMGKIGLSNFELSKVCCFSQILHKPFQKMPFKACPVFLVLKPALFEVLDQWQFDDYVYVHQLFEIVKSDTKLMERLLKLDPSLLGMYF